MANAEDPGGGPTAIEFDEDNPGQLVSDALATQAEVSVTHEPPQDEGSETGISVSDQKDTDPPKGGHEKDAQPLSQTYPQDPLDGNGSARERPPDSPPERPPQDPSQGPPSPPLEGVALGAARDGGGQPEAGSEEEGRFGTGSGSQDGREGAVELLSGERRSGEVAVEAGFGGDLSAEAKSGEEDGALAASPGLRVGSEDRLPAEEAAPSEGQGRDASANRGPDKEEGASAR